MLGLELNSHGFYKHVRTICQKARSGLRKLKRFSGLNTKLKLRLYKSIIRPTIEYPPVPLHAASRNCMYRLQAIQNTALLWAHGTRYPDPRPSITELHHIHRLEPMNCRLASRMWARLGANEDGNYEELMARMPHDGPSHRWWPRSLPLALGQPPQPIFKRGRN